jgi:hypothetical protein
MQNKKIKSHEVQCLGMKNEFITERNFVGHRTHRVKRSGVKTICRSTKFIAI